MITKNFSGSEKVRNWHLVILAQPYSLLPSNDDSTFHLNPKGRTEWMPCPNQSNCSIVQRWGRSHIMHLLTNFFESEIFIFFYKHLSLLNKKSIPNLLTSREVFNNHSLWNDNRFTQLQNYYSNEMFNVLLSVLGLLVKPKQMFPFMWTNQDWIELSYRCTMSYGNSAFLVLNGTSLNSNNALLALSWRYMTW